jgi:hypothetical protein
MLALDAHDLALVGSGQHLAGNDRELLQLFYRVHAVVVGPQSHVTSRSRMRSLGVMPKVSSPAGALDPELSSK